MAAPLRWFLLLAAVSLSKCIHIEREMTITIQPGQQDCFWQEIQKGQVLDIEYQVIDGGQGELDINFFLFTPAGVPIVSEYRKSDSAHRQLMQQEGDYRFCWDNNFSHYNAKTVFFEIVVETEDDDDQEGLWAGGFDGMTGEDVYDMKINDIEDALNRIRTHATKVRHFQDQLRAFEARDRNIAEGNFTRVNNWSLLQICIMLLVGFVQVIMLKSLFDDKSRLHQLWKKGWRT